MEEIYKLKLESTNFLKNCACSLNGDEYINLTDNYILVRKKDLNYIFNNFKVSSAEYLGNLFNREEILEDK